MAEVVGTVATHMARRFDNIENNEQVALLPGGNMGERTLWIHHDNPWIRLPARALHVPRLYVTADGWTDLDLAVYYITTLPLRPFLLTFDLIDFFRRTDISRRTYHMFFIATMVAASIPLFISLSRNQFPLWSLMIESVAAVAWAIFQRFEGASGDSVV
ncbi:hypothetical protein T440DRAFT_469044 [Plenodomus tracheiphilus IPT5]|uniref:Uncharacterized protein n=1 Tax=Plenodomus tracheiphilus IPT5 TaxID=1408161 RepID=A0A6A7B5L6_9PLEO|nr:hypothetical protein T440DRAFT_469044 [Plenodomus tracheiphilus IPT5]